MVCDNTTFKEMNVFCVKPSKPIFLVFLVFFFLFEYDNAAVQAFNFQECITGLQIYPFLI